MLGNKPFKSPLTIFFVSALAIFSFSNALSQDLLCIGKFQKVNQTDVVAFISKYRPRLMQIDGALELPEHLSYVAEDERLPADILHSIRSKTPLTPEQLERIKTWAIDHVLEKRMKSYVEQAFSPEGQELRKFSLFTSFFGEGGTGMGDRRTMDHLLDDVAFFSPGHGTPGGKEHVLKVFAELAEEGKNNRLRISLDVDLLATFFASMPGTQSARIAFYSSCSAGLASGERPSNAEFLARQSQKQVVAPLGVLTQYPSREKNLKITVHDPNTGKLLPPESAFAVFNPDGSRRIIDFEEFKKLVFKNSPDSTISYEQ